MKKISLKDVKNGLKRDEMRMISGGSGGSGDACKSGAACSVKIEGGSGSGSGSILTGGICGGTIGNNSVSCYCTVQGVSYTSVTNQSGMSHCWK